MIYFLNHDYNNYAFIHALNVLVIIKKYFIMKCKMIQLKLDQIELIACRRIVNLNNEPDMKVVFNNNK